MHTLTLPTEIALNANSSTSKFKVFDGSTTRIGTTTASSTPGTDGNADGAAITPDGNISVSRATGASSVFSGYTTGNSTATARIQADGNIYSTNVTFNLEPENPDNYTTTEEEYEVEVPVLRPDGPVTTDLVDGEPEQEMQTVTRTREVKTYTGPTMDVKDTLLKITEALTQLKTAAAASATTCEELRNAIDTALADV